MKLAALLTIIAVTVTACPSTASLDDVMGRSGQGTPVPAKQTLDCDLIFPGPDNR